MRDAPDQGLNLCLPALARKFFTWEMTQVLWKEEPYSDCTNIVRIKLENVPRITRSRVPGAR